MGRPKGSINKNKQLVRMVLENALGTSIPEKIYELNKSNPQKLSDALIQLMPYCYPKLQTMVLEAELDANVKSEEVEALCKWMERLDQLK